MQNNSPSFVHHDLIYFLFLEISRSNYWMINDVVKRNIEQSIGRESVWSAGPFVKYVHINCMLPFSRNYRQINSIYSRLAVYINSRYNSYFIGWHHVGRISSKSCLPTLQRTNMIKILVKIFNRWTVWMKDMKKVNPLR